MSPFDVLVVGEGPAAFAVAAALAARGPRVAMLGPTGTGRWPARYGAWAGELAAAGLGDCTSHAWPRAVVDAGSEGRHVLARPYALVDNERLRAVLAERCEAGGVRPLLGEAAGVEHGDDVSTVVCRCGGTVPARVVVDATGHRPALVRRPAAPAPAFQTAYGVTLRAGEGWRPDPDEAVLMDWRAPGGGPEQGPPSFLYAFPLPDGRLFVEETVLAACPAVGEDVLRARLAARLRGLGVPADGAPGRAERVWIPMGGALPDPDQRVVGFGAAGGLVHPATGYSLARSFAAAPRLARALADALGREGGSPAAAARAGWDALWPADARRRHALHRFGMEVLVSLDAAGTRAFFGRFFGLGAADWSGYLEDRLSAAELAGVMGRFFARAPRELRGVLAARALGPDGRELAGSLVGSLVG